MQSDVLRTGLFALASALVAFYVLSTYPLQLAQTCSAALSAINCSLALELAKYASGIIGLLGLVQIVLGFTHGERPRVTAEIKFEPKFEAAGKEKVVVVCPYCRAKNEENARYCSSCSRPIETRKPEEKVVVVCPKCGARNDEKSKFCSSCGEPIAAPEEQGG